MGARGVLRRAGGGLKTSGTRGRGGGKLLAGKVAGAAHVVMHNIEIRCRTLL